MRRRHEEVAAPKAVVAVSTSFTTDDMTTQQVIEKLSEIDVAYADLLWDRCYAMATLHSRKDWTATGRNRRPTFDDFVEYIRHTWEKKDFSRNEIREMVLTYNTYSVLKLAPDAVALIKEMASISSAYRAIPFVKAHPDRVLDILKDCQTIKDKGKLQSTFVSKYPLPGHGKPRDGGPIDIDDGRITKANAVLAYLASNPIRVIADQMFVLRSIPADTRAQEWAWYSVVRAYIDYHDGTIGVDDIFADMFDQWVDTMDDDERATVLEAAEKDWKSQCDSRGIEMNEWPFAD